ncbi:LuxR C-terminal-related transcriptional regulator [Herbiconiux sp. P15]|uniref:LuxR C-terminal-related transcriptional regulator n=1 Tax=Herbiconiux liukaitaii TaxID=3342799 RepID=UPI0035BA176A
MSSAPVEEDLRTAIEAQVWDDVIGVVEQHWGELVQHRQDLLVEAINSLPAEVLAGNPRLSAAKDYVNYLPANSDGRPIRFQHTVTAPPTGLLDVLADLTSRSVSARFQGNTAESVAIVREAHTTIAEVSDEALAAIRPVLPDIRLQWAISLELGGELIDATRAYERSFDEAVTFKNPRIAVEAAGTIALNYALAGNRGAAEQWLARRPELHVEAPDTVQTAGELARALLAVNDLRFDDARAALEAAPSVTVAPETWAQRLFVESVLARASGQARQQLARVGSTQATQPEKLRSNGLNGWLTAMATAELQLSLGDVASAVRSIARLRAIDLPSVTDPVRVLRAWAALRQGDAREALVLAAPGLSQPSTSPRITVELLAVVAAANLRLDQPEEADRHFAACLDLLVSEGLPIVLLRLTTEERAALLPRYEEQLPPRVVRELAGLLDVGTAPSSVQLSERERVVLRHLVQGHSVPEIATAEHVSPNTVKTQVKAVYRKLGVADRDGAHRAVAATPHLIA